MIDEAMAFACSINAFSSMDAGGGLTLEAILGGEEVPDGLGGIAYDSVPDIDEQAVYNGAEVTFIEDILKAQGVSPEQIEQLLAMYEQVAVLGGGGGAGKVSTASGDDAVRTEDITLNFIEDILKAQGMAPAEVEQLLAMYEQMGLVGEDGELMPEGLPLDFLEQMLGGEQSDTVGGLTLEAIPDTDDEVSVVVNHEEQYDPDVLRGLAVADPAGTVEAAVAAAAAQRGIDPAALQQMTLEDILGLLAED
jgi:hypothetical protein